MKKIDFIELSKIVSHALRHEPQSYNIVLDSEGWVTLPDLVSSLNNKGIIVTDEVVSQMVELSDKRRHQISNGRIRAFYGHSTDKKIIKSNSIPPDVLYHGTIANNLDSILDNGILPMKRQYVHLSIDEHTAKKVASRRRGEIAIIKVEAKEAYKDGIQFYKEENGIWLSEVIPTKYIYINT